MMRAVRDECSVVRQSGRRISLNAKSLKIDKGNLVIRLISSSNWYLPKLCWGQRTIGSRLKTSEASPIVLANPPRTRDQLIGNCPHSRVPQTVCVSHMSVPRAGHIWFMNNDERQMKLIKSLAESEEVLLAAHIRVKDRPHVQISPTPANG